VTERNGAVVGTLPVMPNDEIMAITKNGMIVRCPAEGVRQTGRSTQGVRLITLKGNDAVSSVANVISAKDD